MHHRLSLFEYVLTLVLVIGVISLCYQYLGLSLITLVEQSFNILPKH